MSTIPELYFKNDIDFRKWLHDNHNHFTGIYLIFYKLDHKNSSMRWEEAVRVALCYGWIDSTVKSLGNGKRRQYFCPRKPNSVWSKVNKIHVQQLVKDNLMHERGLSVIKIAKNNGSWVALDDVENGVIPNDLQKAFDSNKLAFTNFKGFTKGQRKGYLYWLHQAKREVTRQTRISVIIQHCKDNIKYRDGGGR